MTAIYMKGCHAVKEANLFYITPEGRVKNSWVEVSMS